jgi:hypothetical protein
LSHQLHSIEHEGWTLLVNLNESLLHLSADHEHIWLCPEEQLLEKPRYVIQDPKMMLLIVWNLLGFYLLDMFPQGRAFRTEYYCRTNLTVLLPLNRQVDERKRVLYAENAKPSEISDRLKNIVSLP